MNVLHLIIVYHLRHYDERQNLVKFKISKHKLIL